MVCCTEVGCTICTIHGSPERPCTGGEQNINVFKLQPIRLGINVFQYSLFLYLESLSSLDDDNLLHVSAGGVTRVRCSAMTPEARFHTGRVVFTLAARSYSLQTVPLPVQFAGVTTFHLGDAVWSAAACTGCAEPPRENWDICHHPLFFRAPILY